MVMPGAVTRLPALAAAPVRASRGVCRLRRAAAKRVAPVTRATASPVLRRTGCARSIKSRVACQSQPEEAEVEVLPEPAAADGALAAAVEEEEDKSGLFKALGILGGVLVTAGIVEHDWVAQNSELVMTALFTLGYAGIIFEENVALNKSAIGLVMAVSLWTIHTISYASPEVPMEQLAEQVSDVSGIIFFLFGAMTIVEVVDAHQGFKIITDAIDTDDMTTLVWFVGILTFCLSAVLDNLTSTIVMVSLLRKLVKDPERRKLLGAVVVIAANAGGAWTPIGDVTTTMLWINGQISTMATMKDLVLPSAVSLAVPLALITNIPELQGKNEAPESAGDSRIAPNGILVFFVGLASLIFVPVFKATTGLPPYLGMLFGLGSIWLLTDALHHGKPDRDELRVPNALTKIDTQGIFFFLGILMSIAALDSSGILKELAIWLSDHVPSQELIAALIGLASAVIDNVPLVAATMGMYDMTNFPQDDELWQLIAYCAGTGGSILIIGSAAGVAFMGMEKADFVWYTRRVSLWALSGYVAGIGVYLLEHNLAGSLPVLASLPFLN